MGNESSKNKSVKSSNLFNLKSGPSVSVIQRHLETAKKSRVLQLKGSGLKTVPIVIEEVACILRNLDLSQNKIREIPLFISNFTTLKQLNFSENLLTVLPDEIGNLKSLELLNLNNNQLIDLPHTLVGCVCLKNLILSKNKFLSFPTVLTQLKEIEVIDLSNNLIESLPNEIKDCQAVEINLNFNRLNSLSNNLALCNKLKIFRVDENCLQKNQFTKDILENSKISLITYAGNLFQDKDFQNLQGYETYQDRYTALKKKGV